LGPAAASSCSVTRFLPSARCPDRGSVNGRSGARVMVPLSHDRRTRHWRGCVLRLGGMTPVLGPWVSRCSASVAATAAAAALFACSSDRRSAVGHDHPRTLVGDRRGVHLPPVAGEGGKAGVL